MKSFFIPLFLLSWITLFADSSIDTLMQEANAHYRAAEQASTFQERKNGFNHALTLYWEIEKQLGMASEELDQALADTYFQLGEYAWSILYNERALQLDPNNRLVAEHLHLAQAKLGLSPSPHFSSWFDTFLLSPYFSLPARWQLFFYSILVTTFMATVFIWFPASSIKTLTYLSGSLSLVLSLNLLLSFYFAPLYGIFISSTAPYRGPSFQELQLSDLPFFAGSKVKIIQSEEQGFWLKVMDLNGQIGYVPASTIRLI